MVRRKLPEEIVRIDGVSHHLSGAEGAAKGAPHFTNGRGIEYSMHGFIPQCVAIFRELVNVKENSQRDATTPALGDSSFTLGECEAKG